jgi:quercetin dioxygenase-like cupin family protein
MDSMRPSDFREDARQFILMRRREDRLLSRWRTGETNPSHPAARPSRRSKFERFKETVMFNLKTKLATAVIAVVAAGFTTPAMAGQCSVAGNSDLANAPTMPKGVTDTVIGSVDLGPEIGVGGRLLRTRRLVVQPGGIVPLHSHKDRPALIYTLSGSITEYSTACGKPIEHKAGDISREADGLSHYWVNHGKVPTVLLSSDVFNNSK